jgi:hypothetical protein
MSEQTIFNPAKPRASFAWLANLLLVPITCGVFLLALEETNSRVTIWTLLYFLLALLGLLANGLLLIGWFGGGSGTRNIRDEFRLMSNRME